MIDMIKEASWLDWLISLTIIGIVVLIVHAILTIEGDGTYTLDCTGQFSTSTITFEWAEDEAEHIYTVPMSEAQYGNLCLESRQ